MNTTVMIIDLEFLCLIKTTSRSNFRFWYTYSTAWTAVNFVYSEANVLMNPYESKIMEHDDTTGNEIKQIKFEY